MFGAPFPRMHVSLYVEDVVASERFYTLLFGMPPVKQKADYLKYLIPSPALIISFVQRPQHAKPTFGHLGIQVATEHELLAHLTRLKQAGLQTIEEMGTTCCYAVQDKFWVQDPDGHHWEIYVFTEDADFEAPKQSMPSNSAAACCTPVVGGQGVGAVSCC